MTARSRGRDRDAPTSITATSCITLTDADPASNFGQRQSRWPKLNVRKSEDEVGLYGVTGQPKVSKVGRATYHLVFKLSETMSTAASTVPTSRTPESDVRSNELSWTKM